MSNLKGMGIKVEQLKDYRHVLLLAVSIMVFAGVIIMLLIPAWDKYVLREKEYDLYKGKIEILEGFAREHQTYDQAYAAKQQEYLKLRESWPKGLQEYDYIKLFHSLARGAGVVVEIDRAVEARKNQKGLQSIALSISAKGEYKAIIKFLEALEEKAYFSLDKLQMESDSRGIITASGCLKVYI